MQHLRGIVSRLPQHTSLSCRSTPFCKVNSETTFPYSDYLFCLVEGGDELVGNEVEAVMFDVKKGRGIGRVVR
jgi:hypothetical protein